MTVKSLKNNSFRLFAAQKDTSLKEGGYYSFRLFAAQKDTSLKEGGYNGVAHATAVMPR